MPVYLVTGVTSGIGYALAGELLKEGHKVLGVGRNEAAVRGFQESDHAANFHFKQFDITEANRTEEEVFANFCSDHGKLDGMVLCAGIEETLPLALYSADKVEKIFRVNVFSQFEILRIFSKKKYSNDSASVVLLSSVMGILGQPGKTAYCSTKAALLGLVKSGALELAKRNIRVNAVLPGIVQTPLTTKLFNGLSPEQVEEIINKHPLGIGKVDDIIPTIQFLLSNKSKWITGQDIIIDGGYSIQ